VAEGENAAPASTGGQVIAQGTFATEQGAQAASRSTSRSMTTVATAAMTQLKAEPKSESPKSESPKAETPRAESKPEPKTEPAPLTNGVIQTQPIAAIPGSSEPMKPVRVKTVQIKAGPVKLAAAGPAQPSTPVTSVIPAHSDVAETSNAVVAKAEIGKSETGKAEVARTDLPPQPANHGTGNGILGVLPASSVTSRSASQAMAYGDLSQRSQAQPQSTQQGGATKPEATHSGWIIQVGALETEEEARQRIEAARSQAHGLLNKADPFTEPVLAKGDKKLYRARFAGLDRDQAEAVCRALKHSEISCITVRN
jgi:D-alanyl-D-alanine carboxypeptidase